ncbi:MAG: sensor histidine kinase [Marmoricola sp.]
METREDVLDLLPDGVVLADADGTVTHVNEAARRLLGAAARVGAPLATVMALQDEDARDWVTTVCPYGGLSTRVGVPEMAWLTASGTEVLVTARLHRARRGGPVTAVAAVVRSGRGRERLDRDRSDLVATVAHELRSPLTGVKGFVTTLLNRWDRLSDEQKKLLLTTVHADSERLSRLITELLDVARIDTGRLPLYRRELPVGPAVDAVVDSVRAGTGRRIVASHADPQAPVFADPDKFSQVVTNLVENAVRHGEGEVRVTTSVWAGGVELVVDDEGEGIPEAIRRRVFTKFWKQGVRGGSGLGMYIVNGLAQVHGGSVSIGDAPGGGARLVVRWPSTDPAAGPGPAD